MGLCFAICCLFRIPKSRQGKNVRRATKQKRWQRQLATIGRVVQVANPLDDEAIFYLRAPQWLSHCPQASDPHHVPS
jgi:hypothetical protein